MLDLGDAFRNALSMLCGPDHGVVLHVESDDFFDFTGPLPAAYGEQRRHPRFYFRAQAIAEYREKISRVFTLDMSRGGLAFLHRTQIFPLECVRLWLPGEVCLRVAISRCIRLRANCYQCGARMFARDESASPAELGRLIKQLYSATPEQDGSR